MWSTSLLTNVDRSLLEELGLSKVEGRWELWKSRVTASSDRMSNGEDNELDQKIAANHAECEKSDHLAGGRRVLVLEKKNS